MSAGGPLALRLGLAVAALLLAALLAAALLLADLRDRAEAELRAARFTYTVATLKVSLETALGLGLSLPSLEGAQALIDDELARDPDLLSIDIFAADGRLLFTTDTVGIRSRVPERWHAALDQPLWRVEDRGVEALGSGLENAFGVVVGGIALRHAAPTASVLSLAPDRLPAAALAGLWALATLLAGLGFVLLLRRDEAALAALATATGPWRGSAVRSQGPDADRHAGRGAALPVGPALAAFEDRCRMIEARLAAADAEIARLDRQD